MREMLDSAGIEYEFIDRSNDVPIGAYEHYQILIPNVISVVEGTYTYGAGTDQLEIMKLTRRSGRDVSGWMSAEEVFEMVRKFYEKVTK